MAGDGSESEIKSYYQYCLTCFGKFIPDSVNRTVELKPVQIDVFYRWNEYNRRRWIFETTVSLKKKTIQSSPNRTVTFPSGSPVRTTSKTRICVRGHSESLKSMTDISLRSQFQICSQLGVNCGFRRENGG